MDTKRKSDFLSSAVNTLIKQGLRADLLRVYRFMGLGLLVSALTAYLGSTPTFLGFLSKISPSGTASTIWSWSVIIIPFILVFKFSSAINKFNAAKAQTIFWIFSALMGFSLSRIFIMFTSASLFQAFIITAGAFGGLCLYGHTTKKDLTGLGIFMGMGLWGIIIAVIVNIFLGSPAIAYGISIITVLVFSGLTAYDSQHIEKIYNPTDSLEASQSKAIAGALALYLDFINLFLGILRLIGESNK